MNAAPDRFKAPHWCGLRLGAYLLVVELLFVIMPVMYKLHQSGLLLLIVATAILYAGLLTALAWLLGRVGWLARHPAALLFAVLGVLVAGTLAVGENAIPVLLFGVPAALMALAGTHMSGRPTRLRLILRGVVVLLFAAALLPLLVPSPGQRSPTLAAPPADAPNIVMIVLDTVRLDHLSTYGYERETSPALSRIAAQGMRFDEARVNGMWSLPSHASFFTGLPPSVHGAHYENWALEGDTHTIAEVLSDHGYRTLCVTGNPLISRGLGTAAGFHEVEESWRSYWVQESMSVWRMLRPVWDRDRDKGGASTVRFLRRWFSQEQRRPFLLVVNVMDPHAPYNDVPAEYQDRFRSDGVSRGEARRLSAKVFFHHVFAGPLSLTDDELDTVKRSYDGSVAYGDAVLGEIVDALDEQGLGDDTLLIVTSDHGELLGEHGGTWGHVHTLYDELLRVPLVMRYPQRIPAGRVSNVPVESLDLVPTVYAAAGVPAAERPATGGADLAPFWPAPGGDNGGEDGERPGWWMVAEHFVPSMLPESAGRDLSGERGELFVRRRAVLAGETKYVVSSSGTEVLHDLAVDPGETRDMSRQDAPRMERGRNLLSAWVEAGDLAWGEQTEGVGPELDPATRQRLKELGYIE